MKNTEYINVRSRSLQLLEPYEVLTSQPQTRGAPFTINSSPYLTVGAATLVIQF
jgi:hypothetical protein